MTEERFYIPQGTIQTETTFANIKPVYPSLIVPVFEGQVIANRGPMTSWSEFVREANQLSIRVEDIREQSDDRQDLFARRI